MSSSHSTISAVLFFGFAMFWIWNPEFLPARDMFNDVLEVTFGWMR